MATFPPEINFNFRPVKFDAFVSDHPFLLTKPGAYCQIETTLG